MRVGEGMVPAGRGKGKTRKRKERRKERKGGGGRGRWAVWRSLLSLQSLRASTRVSPGFALFRHSSPSFGSRHTCSHSNLSAVAKWSVDAASFAKQESNHHFHCALWFATTILAPVSDSLVRVSRRDKEHHSLTPTDSQCSLTRKPYTAHHQR